MRQLLLTLKLFFAIVSLLGCINIQAQEPQTVFADIPNVSNGLLSGIDARLTRIESKVHASSSALIDRVRKNEARLKRRLMKIDSVLASEIFDAKKNIDSLYYDKIGDNDLAQLEGKVYDEYSDKMATALKYTRGVASDEMKEKLKQIAGLEEKFSKLTTQFDKTQYIEKVLKDRQAYLKEKLANTGLVKSLLNNNKEVYYYSQKIKMYRSMLREPGKLEQKFLQAITELPAFQQFMARHSAFAQLFPIPGMVNGEIPPGVQTIAQLQQILQTQNGLTEISPEQMLQGQLQQAQNAMSTIQDKLINKLGGTGSGDQPEFTPNDQKTKPFKHRLVVGTNLQNQKSSNFFPITSDVGLSLGYKINDKSTIGIGASYKLGWGKDIRHIKLTNEGIGVRTFLDWKMKGSFYISGGYEQNYRSGFKSITQLKGLPEWNPSGLVGISKIVSLKTKVFKQTKMQLLWDFLSYRTLPREQPIKFRLGYDF